MPVLPPFIDAYDELNKGLEETPSVQPLQQPILPPEIPQSANIFDVMGGFYRQKEPEMSSVDTLMATLPKSEPIQPKASLERQPAAIPSIPLTSPMPSPAKFDSSDLDKKMLDATSSRNNLQFLSNLGTALNQTIAGITKTPTQTQVFQQLGKQAEQPLQDIASERQARQEELSNALSSIKLANEKDRNDPNSPSSKLAQNFYKQIAKDAGININTENASLSQLEKVYGNIESYARYVTAKKEAQQQKKDQRLSKAVEDMGKDLDPNRARTGEVGLNQRRVNAAERVVALYNATGGNPNNINMRELATSVADMLSSGGRSAVSQINELVPHTISGDAAKIKQWLTDNPTGTDQQKFAEMYLHIAEREKDVAQNQIDDALIKKANSTWQNVKKDDPDAYYRTLAVQLNKPINEIIAREKLLGTGKSSKKQEEKSLSSPNEEERMTKDGRTAIFDKISKQFIRWK